MKAKFKKGDIVKIIFDRQRSSWYIDDEILLISDVNDKFLYETDHSYGTYKFSTYIHEDFIYYVSNIHERRKNKLKTII